MIYLLITTAFYAFLDTEMHCFNLSTEAEHRDCFKKRSRLEEE